MFHAASGMPGRCPVAAKGPAGGRRRAGFLAIDSTVSALFHAGYKRLLWVSGANCYMKHAHAARPELMSLEARRYLPCTYLVTCG